MRKSLTTIMLLLLALVTSACVTNANGQSRTKELIGTVAGGALGGWGGSQFGGGKGKTAMTIFGTLLGGYAGNQAGKSLDRADRLASQQNASNSLEYAPNNRTTSWSNPTNRTSGTFTPTRTGTDNRTGDPCRNYEQTVTIGGRVETVHGTACRENGLWQIRNTTEPTYTQQQSRNQHWTPPQQQRNWNSQWQ